MGLALVLAIGCGDDDSDPPSDAGADATTEDGGLDGGPGDAGPCPSRFAPVGCRTVPVSSPALPARDGWHNLHADGVNSDEVGVALAPRFAEDWVAEEDTFNVTGPIFDAAGNLYFSPLRPRNGLAMISIDAATGERRFAVEGDGALSGGGTPLVLADPDAPSREVVYLGLYDRVVAVETDGTEVFDVPTGLDSAEASNAVFGLNYLPQHDALVGLAQDGRVYLVARDDGRLLLDPPYSLPGEPSPGGTTALPESLAEDVAVELAPFFAEGDGGADLLSVLLGNATEVANFFSVDPATGTLWIAATAPDAEDGTTDGVSELGALYALEVEDDAGTLTVVERCHASFDGGSASTPALRQDGSRVFVADNVGTLIAIDPDCSEAWRFDIGAQVIGSIGVASDNREIYAATGTEIVSVTDEGSSASLRYRVTPPGPTPEPRERAFNLNLVAITESGIAYQAGVGRELGGQGLPRTTGVGLLDRATGDLRFFTEGLDETVAVMSVGPDGGLYIGNSPLRRAIHRAVYGATASEPLRGGITRFAPDERALAREAVCAGAARAANAAMQTECADAVAADVEQLGWLIAQARGALEASDPAQASLDAAASALGEGDLAGAQVAFETARDSLWP